MESPSSATWPIIGMSFSNHDSLRQTPVATLVQAYSMAAVELHTSPRDRRFEAAVEKVRAGVQAMAAWVREAEGEALGEGLIQIRSVIDRSESVFADGVRRFDRSGEYKTDGALSLTEWLRSRCKLSGAAAAERVEIAR